MPDLLVQLDAGMTIRGTIIHDFEYSPLTRVNYNFIPQNDDGVEVFSAHDCIMVLCNKSKAYARQLCRRLKKTFEMDKLVWYVPLRIKSRPSPYKQPVVTREGPALTWAGLKFLLLYLETKNKLKLDDNTFTRFMTGERSMIIEFDLDSLVPRK